MTEDKEIKRWIDRQRKFLKCYIEWAEPKEGDENVEALEGTLGIAERYLEVGEIDVEGIVSECDRTMCCYLSDEQISGIASLIKTKLQLAYTKQMMERLEGVEAVIDRTDPKSEIAKAIRNHLVDGNKTIGEGSNGVD